MRVPLWVWMIAPFALLLALAAGASAQDTYYFHSTTASGNADSAMGDEPYFSSAPPGDALGVYTINNFLVAGPTSFDKPHFIGVDTFDLNDGTVEVVWWEFQDGSNFPCAPSGRVELWGDTGSGWVELARSPNYYTTYLPVPEEHAYTFTGITISGQLLVKFDVQYINCDIGLMYLYDNAEVPSRVTITNGNGAPTATLTADVIEGVAEQDVSFHLDIVDDGAYTYTFDADGDGVAEQVGGVLAPGGVDFPFTYAGAYKGDAVLSVVDDGGLTSEAKLAMNIRAPFKVDLGNPLILAPGQSHTIMPSISGGADESHTCAWTGDIASLNDAALCSPTFQSADEGTFTLTLNATQDGGRTDSDALIVEVIDPTDPDVDDDGILNDADNCPNAANAEQADHDEDGRGDACDTDDDNDTVLDAVDNCPLLANIGQLDTDHDGIGDVCDDDDDGDAVQDTSDNCPLHANANQQDLDGDGKGDACDADRDGDGRADAFDAFPDDSSEWSDTDHDGVGDNADTDDDGDGILDEDEVETGFDDSVFASRPEGELPADPADAPTEDSPGLGSLMVLALVAVAYVVRRK